MAALQYGQDAVPEERALHEGAKVTARYTRVEYKALKHHIKHTYHVSPQVYPSGMPIGTSDNCPDRAWEFWMLEPTAERPYYTVLTVGVGAGDSPESKRVEFMLMLPEEWQLSSQALLEERWAWPFTVLNFLSSTPDVNSLAQDTAHLRAWPQRFAPDTEQCALLLYAAEDIDYRLKSCPLPGGKIVHFYQVVPLYQTEYDYAQDCGIDNLADLMSEAALSLEIDPHRRCIYPDLSADEGALAEPELSAADFDEPELSQVELLARAQQKMRAQHRNGPGEIEPALEHKLLSYAPREQAAIEQHIRRNFGVTSFVDECSLVSEIELKIHVIEPTEFNPYYLLVSSGFGAYCMDLPEGLADLEWERAEFVMVLPPDWMVSDEYRADERWSWPFFLMHALVAITLEQHEFMMMGKVVSLGHNLADNTQFCGCMLVPADCDPVIATLDAEVCQLPQGKKVNFYFLAPLYRDEIDFVKKYGPERLFRAVVEQGLVVDVNRPHLVAHGQHHHNQVQRDKKRNSSQRKKHKAKRR